MTGDYVFQFHRDQNARMWRRKDLVFGGKEVGGVKDRANHYFAPSRVADCDVDDETFFGVMLQYSHKRSLIGAFFHVQGGGEHQQANGLVAGHLYSVLDVRRAGTMMGMGGGYKLVKLGTRGPPAPWRGAWSDGAAEWARHPAVAHEVEYTDTNDGSFWMAYEDFARVFTACGGVRPHHQERPLPGRRRGRRVPRPGRRVRRRLRRLLVLLPGRAHHLLRERHLGQDGVQGGLLRHQVTGRARRVARRARRTDDERILL